jgi:hypothetical protein
MTETALDNTNSPQTDTVAFLRIDAHLIDSVWSKCKDFLPDSFSPNAPSYDLNDVYDSLVSGETQLWVAVGHGKILAAAVTMITAEPKARTLAVLNVGGKELKSWVNQMDAAFTNFAAQHGCDYIEAVTRKGFHRFLPDFIEDGIVYIKRVGTVQ